MAAKLNVGKVLLGAFLVPWWNRRAFLRTLWMPFVALTVVDWLSKQLGGPLGWGAVWGLIISFPIFVVFVVLCHRLVLLDAGGRGFRSFPTWSWRETRFALLAFGLALVCVIVMVAMAAVLSMLPLWNGERPLDHWPKYLAALPAYYVFARTSLVLPATAVDRRVNFAWAWRQTDGNGWRLVVVVGALPFFLSQAVDLIYRSGATVLQTLMVGVLTSLLTIVEVAALSLSYKELGANE